jgi:hypothetical protein
MDDFTILLLGGVLLIVVGLLVKRFPMLIAGQSFRFDKNGLHSVTAQGKFKMSLLLVIE